MQRRDFFKNLGVAAGSVAIYQNSYSIPATGAGRAQKIRFGMITDLHHLQFGQEEVRRLGGFMDDVVKTNPDFIIQCGDFCRHTRSEGIMAQWNRFKGPKYHVLGNHDMDYCSKETIMEFWGMPKRYYSFDQGGFHFVIMDRNFLKEDDGRLTHYDTSNWGKLPSPKRSFTDQEQLDWLRTDLLQARFPVVVFMHQPVYLTDFYDEIGNADEILKIFDEVNFKASQSGSAAKVVTVFMGHDHDDRYGQRNGVHYFIVNSATYVYTKGGAYYYKDPLYAFVTLDTTGKMTLEGRSTIYAPAAAENVTSRFPTRISDHEVRL
ncbi:3',5'-cyclic AMP phosphodiesterase CpdA [Dyadobacter sp. SG02]|uniref:metallophosphoesterase family protein n=1 Tax=Dyadobacter sp. SG02 TaxID=1855291 RepID=UPI0008C1D0E1|nr:metallophosphoesterase [Dyadobacter sp. SG02]SEJ00847.1 3',5'-cyclic AMP phosphodiesterase CpdA [Dyadobacter sp. SG02]